MNSLYVLWLMMTLASCFELEEELLYCPDSVKINFAEKCETHECIKQKNNLLSYINQQDFYFRIGMSIFIFVLSNIF